MVIKKYKIIFFIIILSFIGFASLQASTNSQSIEIKNPSNNFSDTDNSDCNNNKAKTSELELPDKVYSFTLEDNNLTFESVYLETKYIYYIYIELVTPHNVSNMRITIWDTDDKKFVVFESEMYYSPECGRSFEIPFGTVDSGHYRFEFLAELEQNFNLHVKIEQGPKCLHDKMDSQEINNLLLYKVNRFESGMYIEHDVGFETDKMYKFYIGRVSAISIKDSNEVRIDFIITDPEDVDFVIYSNELMADIDGVNSFYFGTALDGVYTIKITIRCDVNYVNIAYAIIDNYEIGDAIEDTDIESKDSDETNDNDESEDFKDDIWENSALLPVEWVVGTLIFVSGIIGSTTIALLNHRKRNAVKLNIRNKY